jgi:hypothetical protein
MTNSDPRFSAGSADIEALEAEVERRHDELQTAKQRLTDAKIAICGVEIGDIVVKKGKRYRVTYIDVSWMSSPPWVKGVQQLKDGSWGTGAARATGLPPSQMAIEVIVTEAMQDRWNDICADTGCHPLDIKQAGKGRLEFHIGHWARQVGKQVALALTRPASAPQAARYVYQCWNPECDAIWDENPNGPCPKCKRADGGGSSTICRTLMPLPSSPLTRPHGGCE